MSIFIDKNTKIIVQGMTGNEGSYWSEQMIKMGSQVVAGITPGREGQIISNKQIFNSVRRALKEHIANASLIFTPPRFTKDAVFEALDSGMKKIVTIAEGIPLHDMVQIRLAAKIENALVIGGNTTGVISPGKAMMGMFPFWIERVYRPGRIGVMTRSGSLTNEVTSMIVEAGFGVSTLIGIGGDPVPGTRFAEMLPFFEADDETDAVVVIGELGGTMEEEVADAINQKVFTKPLVAFLGGRTAPPGKKMGHAGAIIVGKKGTVKGKIEELENAGALVAARPRLVGTYLQDILQYRGKSL